MYSKKCVHNGWRAACRTCVEARQKCSLTKPVPPTVLINDSSLPVAGPSNPQPKVKIVIPRTMYAERYLSRKRVPQSLLGNPSLVPPYASKSPVATSVLPINLRRTTLRHSVDLQHLLTPSTCVRSSSRTSRMVVG